jgi:hypothetical protein
VHEEHVLSIPKNAIEILDFGLFATCVIGFEHDFFEKLHLSHATNLMPNTINKQKYTHGLTSKFMLWVWIPTIVGEFHFRTPKKIKMRLWKQSFKH